MSEEYLSDDLDDISLSESDLAELERQLAEEENVNSETNEASIDENAENLSIEEDGEDETVELKHKNQESSVVEDDEELEDEQPELVKKNSGLSEIEEQIENELDDLADGITELQYAVKLRMRLKEELLEGFHLQHTLAFITEKIDKLKNTDNSNESAPQEEIEDCNERIKELRELLENEKQQNIKMHEAIQKLNTAREKVKYDKELAEKDLITAEKRRQAATSECSAEIKYQTSEFVHCKREQNNTIKSLSTSIEKQQKKKELWLAMNAEIQQDIDDLESTIQKHAKSQDSMKREQMNANEDHSLAVQKQQLKITRQQKQFDVIKAENERRNTDLEEQTAKLEKLKADGLKMKEEIEEFTKAARKLERANARQKTQIQTLESDKEDAKRSLRDAERKLRLKSY